MEHLLDIETYLTKPEWYAPKIPAGKLKEFLEGTNAFELLKNGDSIKITATNTWNIGLEVGRPIIDALLKGGIDPEDIIKNVSFTVGFHYALTQPAEFTPYVNKRSRALGIFLENWEPVPSLFFPRIDTHFKTSLEYSLISRGTVTTFVPAGTELVLSSYRINNIVDTPELRFRIKSPNDISVTASKGTCPHLLSHYSNTKHIDIPVDDLPQLNLKYNKED